MIAPVRVQLQVLTERYADRVLGDVGTLVLLVGQAPFIGWLCTVVWGEVDRDTPSLWFVLALASVWFGAIASCREIVRDRAVLERERLIGVSTLAWIGSCYRVLAVLGAVQVALLLGAVEWKLGLRGPLPLQFASLWLASLAGTGLGLVVSALASTQERAVGAVPLLILPQILFSEFAIPRAAFGPVVGLVEAAMPVGWCYAVFAAAGAVEPSWATVAADLAAQVVVAAGLGALAVLALIPRREVA